MSRQIYIAGVLLLMLAFISCSSSGEAVKEANHVAAKESKAQKSDVNDAGIQERISLNINEAVYFNFIKQDTAWTGDLTIYTLNDEGKKVVQSEYVSAQDSSWQDFELFVDFLKLYQIPPQHKIKGWAPDSGQLPRRVYSFEVFNGGTTRSYSYQDPEEDIRDYWEAQNLLTFVTYIQNDLNWIQE